MTDIQKVQYRYNGILADKLAAAGNVTEERNKVAIDVWQAMYDEYAEKLSEELKTCLPGEHLQAMLTAIRDWNSVWNYLAQNAGRFVIKADAFKEAIRVHYGSSPEVPESIREAVAKL